jgi:DNA-binding NtrC family response regulator
MKRLLIADDDAGMRAALEARFQRRGWLVDVAVNGIEALAKFREGLHSLVITDVRMPGRDGFELMREVQASSARTAVILLTAYGCVPDAVEAMRNGACDYLVKPVCFEKLELAVEQVLRRAEEFGKDTEALIGHSPLWEQALDRARQAAGTDADVLIEAESGTGKELIARLIHRLSHRKAGPFVALNCSAFPKPCSKANCLDTHAAPLLGPSPPGRASSRRRTGARCCSMRLARCHWRCSRNCCAPCRNASSTAGIEPDCTRRHPRHCDQQPSA